MSIRAIDRWSKHMLKVSKKLEHQCNVGQVFAHLFYFQRHNDLDTGHKWNVHKTFRRASGSSCN